MTATPGYDSSAGSNDRGFFYHRTNPLTINNSIVYQMGWDGVQVQDKGEEWHGLVIPAA